MGGPAAVRRSRPTRAPRRLSFGRCDGHRHRDRAPGAGGALAGAAAGQVVPPALGEELGADGAGAL